MSVGPSAVPDHAEHDRVAELLGAYALGAVEPAEQEEVARHLAVCAACRVELAQLEEAVAELLAPSGEPAAEPVPDGVWGRISQRIRGTTSP